MQESREQIKTRLLKNAARAWGYTGTEAENNFDPLVSMLLTATSAELERVSGEIHATRARILERLVQLLSPDALTGALPAHAIACATPVEERITIEENAQYYISRKRPSGREGEEPQMREVYFSPTAAFPLTRASIRYMATGNTIHRVANAANKEVFAMAAPGRELSPSTLWLAIDEPGTPLHDMLFYFDLRNEAGRQLFYHQLPKAVWYWNGQPIGHWAGYGDRDLCGGGFDLETLLRRDEDISGKIRQHVNAFYQPHFITISDPENRTAGPGNRPDGWDEAGLPPAFSSIFSEKSIETLQQQPLRWLAIEFPSTISNRLLQDVVCVGSGFPVINRRLHELTFRLQEIVNIVPLQTEDIFLDLAEASNDEGRILNARSFRPGSEESFSLLLRNGGVGRWDERDAGSIVDYLLQLLRDESAAFSTLGNDFMNSEMRQLQQTINKLEQRLSARQLRREQTPYLVIRHDGKGSSKNIFIKYWSTAGEGGNKIKAGSILRQYKDGGIGNNQVVLVTTTQGGRDRLDTADSVLAYKSALLSRDRLITPEDIKAFCHYQLGQQRVKKIVVTKGILIHPDQQQGFVRTIDVIIDLERQTYEDMLEKGEIVFWKDKLKQLLEERSTALLPFRVSLQQAVSYVQQ